MNIKILTQYLSKQRKQIDQKKLAMIYSFSASATTLRCGLSVGLSVRQSVPIML